MRKGGQAATTAVVASAATTVAFLVKKPVITRLDSGLGDRKMRSTPPEDSAGRTASGRERE